MTAYAVHPRTSRHAFLLAILSNIVGQMLVAWALGAGPGIEVPAACHFVTMPLIILITLVPVTLNGIGLREAAFACFYAGTGVSTDAAISLSLTFTGVMILLSLIGRVVFPLPRYSLFHR